MSMEGEDVDLVADLEAALDAGKPEAAPAEPVDTQEPPAREYSRDEAGKFAPKPPEDSAAQTPPVDPQQPPAKPAWRAPWYKDDYGPWEQLPEALRNALREQERAAQQGIEKHSLAAKTWEPLTKALEPFKQYFNEQYTPQQYFNELHEWNAKFRTSQDPIARIDMLDALAKTVGLDLVQVGEWLAQNGPAPAPDPRDQRLAALENEVKTLRDLPQQHAREAANKQIEDWKEGKDDFEAVRPIMAGLAKQNPQATLDQLYEQARWAHPEIRERILKEQEGKRIAELKDKRAVGATSPRPGDPGVENRGRFAKAKTSVEDDVAAAYDAAMGAV